MRTDPSSPSSSSSEVITGSSTAAQQDREILTGTDMIKDPKHSVGGGKRVIGSESVTVVKQLQKSEAVREI